MHLVRVTVAAAALAGGLCLGQDAPAVAQATTAQRTTAQAAAPAAATGGTIRGSVKAGAVPLPGVAVTATNTLTGKKYATTTDENGAYAMTIPRNGRYVVKAELAAFASDTKEAVVNAASENGGLPVQVADFGMQLASRVAAAEAAQTASAAGATTGARGASLQGRGVQALDVTGTDASLADASAGATSGATTGTITGTAMPTLNGLSGDGGDAVAVSGQQGTTNGLASFSEDDIRQRVTDALAQARAQGQDPTQSLVGMLGQMIAGGGGFGGLGGPGGSGGPGGGRGGGGGGGFGGGAFRNFNPAQLHGNIFYQGGNSALNSAPWSPTLLPQTNPSAYSNRFGVSLAGSPSIPGLFKPDTRQFLFVNLTGQKNLNAFLPNPVRVPTALERTGDFSQSYQSVSGALVPVTLYDPKTGLPIPGNKLSNGTTPVSAQALALLNYYPAPNIQTTDPTAYNYQTLSNAGSNNIAINTRYQRQLGKAQAGSMGRFGGGGGGRGGGGGNGGGGNAPPVLRQNFNVGYNYSHSANDNRNIFLPLGGASESDGNGLNVGYTVSYGRLSNNASINWNRSHAESRNYFTDTAIDPTALAGISVPNRAGSLADPKFYNGVPSISITNFAGLSNATPSQTISQTISFSDFVSWRHKKHNYRFGLDIRRVHADSIGGSNPLGAFTFSGYGTESPDDQKATSTGTTQQATTGAGFADFLLGLPTNTSLQAGLNKIYLRENVYDWYVLDDFRVSANWTLNYGLRYEYFAPYTEKNNRLVNLDHNADFTLVDAVQPGGIGTYGGTYPRSLVNPDRTMFSPRFGAAWRPKFTRETVVRFGYGTNYNTGQFGTFARSLSFQPPFAATQTNVASTVASSTGCTTTSQSTHTTANMTLANGFGCSSTAIQNNYSVNKNYRLGMVQVYNVNIQRTFPQGIVVNVGYNGAMGSNLDMIRAPNHTATTVTSNAAAFRYEDSIAGSRSNSLVVSVQKRQVKGIALAATYTYGHSIDNASSIGGGSGTTAQNDKRLDLEEGNSSFDQRHNLTGNWSLELPFGPNRAYFNKGGVMSHVLDGFNLSGSFTFGSGTYFTPSCSSCAGQALAGGTFALRPDRVFTQSIAGDGKLKSFFNKAAFVKPANGFGTASRNSIEGPGTISTNASLARTIPLGDTRSFEARVTATNVFNTVQYSGINTSVDSANYGQVTSAASMRALQVQARYRF